MPSTKGSTFKGPFHLPRMLSMVDGMLGQILDRACEAGQYALEKCICKAQ